MWLLRCLQNYYDTIYMTIRAIIFPKPREEFNNLSTKMLLDTYIIYTLTNIRSISQCYISVNNNFMTIFNKFWHYIYEKKNCIFVFFSFIVDSISNVRGIYWFYNELCCFILRMKTFLR